MIIYDLSCANDHPFEGWFRSPADFEDQVANALICCPKCSSHQVRRIPSAIALGRSGSKRKSEGAPLSAPASIAAGTQIMAMYRQFVQAMINNSEDVGKSFADEARKIHYDEAPERPIRGQATPDECEALQDEGIEIITLPEIPKRSLN